MTSTSTEGDRFWNIQASVVSQIILTSRHVSVWVHSPPYKGGVAAASIKSREATEEPQTGWSLTRHVSQTHSEASLVSDHPVRAFFRNGSILLMARPPLLCKEGNAPTPNRCQTRSETPH